MGSASSSRWHSYTPKNRADACQRFSVADVVAAIPHDVFAERQPYAGSLVWRRRDGTLLHTVGWSLAWEEETPALILDYKLTNDRTGTSESACYPVELDATACTYGGVRWWVRCPNVPCGRRVGVLYRPAGALYFACRHCHNLNYTSTQQAHRFDRDVGVGALMRMADRSTRIERVRRKLHRAHVGSKRGERLLIRWARLIGVELPALDGE